jgi:hypothetical protein
MLRLKRAGRYSAICNGDTNMATFRQTPGRSSFTSPKSKTAGPLVEMAASISTDPAGSPQLNPAPSARFRSMRRMSLIIIRDGWTGSFNHQRPHNWAPLQIILVMMAMMMMTATSFNWPQDSSSVNPSARLSLPDWRRSQ